MNLRKKKTHIVISDIFIFCCELGTSVTQLIRQVWPSGGVFRSRLSGQVGPYSTINSSTKMKAWPPAPGCHEGKVP